MSRGHSGSLMLAIRQLSWGSRSKKNKKVKKHHDAKLTFGIWPPCRSLQTESSQHLHVAFLGLLCGAGLQVAQCPASHPKIRGKRRHPQWPKQAEFYSLQDALFRTKICLSTSPCWKKSHAGTFWRQSSSFEWPNNRPDSSMFRM